MVSYLLHKCRYPWTPEWHSPIFNYFLDKFISLMKYKKCKFCLSYCVIKRETGCRSNCLLIINRRLSIRSFGRRMLFSGQKCVCCMCYRNRLPWNFKYLHARQFQCLNKREPVWRTSLNCAIFRAVLHDLLCLAILTNICCIFLLQFWK